MGAEREVREFLRSPFAKTLTEEERRDAVTQIRSEFSSDSARFIADERRRQESSGSRNILGSFAAGLINYANSAAFGRLPQLAALATRLSPFAPPELEEPVRRSSELAVQATRETNPAAATTGSIAGLFAPGAGTVLQGATRGVTALTGLGRASQAVAGSGFVAKAGVETLKQLVGASAALTTQRLLESRDDDATLGVRLSDAVEDIRSPVTLGLVGATGLISARFLKPADPELANLFRRYRQLTGRELPPDVVADTAELKKTIDTAARTPGLTNAVQRVQRSVVSGLTSLIDDIGKRASVLRGRGRNAAFAVERLAGAEKPGIITRGRRAAQTAALEAEKANVLDRDGQIQLIRGLRQILQSKATAERRGTEMRRIVRDFLKAARKGPLRLDDLEALRKATAKAAAFRITDSLDRRLTERGRVEATQFYDLLQGAIGRTGNRFSQSLQAGARLRQLEGALRGTEISELDDAALQSFWKGDKVLTKWEAAKEFLSPEDLGAIRGWLFEDLIRSATLKDGTLSLSKLNKTLSQAGRHNRQLIDRVLPGVADDLVGVAKIGERAREGVLKAEGSPTFSRAARLGAATGAIGTVVALLTNPYAALPGVLGAAGTAWIVRRSSLSLIEGNLGQALSLAAQGQAPAALSRLPVAARQEGGNVGPAASSGVRGGARLIQQGAGALMRNQ